MRLRDLLFVVGIIGIPAAGVVAFQHYQPLESREEKLVRLREKESQLDLTVERLRAEGNYAELPEAETKLDLVRRDIRRILD